MEQVREQKLKTYHRHNNAESQADFDINMDHFNRQCKIVLEQLLTGRGMNVKDAMINLNIMHLPRRIKTLRDSGIPVLDRPLGGGRKEYFIDREFLNGFRAA